jgi:two-component system, NarL family, nitrate/nitrite response regulator NarL
MGVLPTRAEQLVLIVEDHRLFAEAVDLALRVAGYDVRRIEVPADPGSPGALVTAIVKPQPVVVLLDLDLGGFGDGVQLIEPIARAGANVIVVTGSTDRARWGDAIQAGARKVLSKSQPLHDILATVRRIIAGLPVMDREEREELVSESTRMREDLHEVRERLEQLTNRESVVLGHLMKGRAVRQIAGLSTVSEATVRTQVKSILAKLEVSSQLAAVGMAHEIGWRAPVG